MDNQIDSNEFWDDIYEAPEPPCAEQSIEIPIVGGLTLKICYRLKWVEKTASFYIDSKGVEHSWDCYENAPITEVSKKRSYWDVEILSHNLSSVVRDLEYNYSDLKSTEVRMGMYLDDGYLKGLIPFVGNQKKEMQFNDKRNK